MSVDINARTGRASDILEAIDQVISAGGIGNVHVPEGRFNLYEKGETWRVVNRPAGVNLFGAPTLRDAYGQVVPPWKTILEMPYDVPGNDRVGIPSWFGITGTADPTKKSRLSDFMLRGYRDFDPSSVSMHCAQEISDVLDFRIDHCLLKHTTAGIFTTADRYPYKIRGVIDHCRLVNDYGEFEPYESRTVGYGVHAFRNWDCTEWEPIGNVVGKYTDYTIFIEDCYLSKWRHCVAGNSGAHYVFRYNTIENDFGFGSLDAHGTYTNVGTRAWEIYNNRILGGPSTVRPWVTFLRGGGGVVFGNYVRGPGYTIVVYMVDEGSVQKCWPQDIYVWNNDIGAGMSLIATWSDKRTITEGRDYFLYQRPGYTPYPYPHPLTLGERVLYVDSNLKGVPFIVREMP